MVWRSERLNFEAVRRIWMSSERQQEKACSAVGLSEPLTHRVCLFSCISHNTYDSQLERTAPLERWDAPELSFDHFSNSACSLSKIEISSSPERWRSWSPWATLSENSTEYILESNRKIQLGRVGCNPIMRASKVRQVWTWYVGAREVLAVKPGIKTEPQKIWLETGHRVHWITEKLKLRRHTDNLSEQIKETFKYMRKAGGITAFRSSR